MGMHGKQLMTSAAGQVDMLFINSSTSKETPTHIIVQLYKSYTFSYSYHLHIQDKKIAHCNLGVWKGESVDNWYPMHAERERLLTLKALLADKQVWCGEHVS